MTTKDRARALMVRTKEIADAIDAVVSENPGKATHLKNSSQLGSTTAFFAANGAGADEWTERLAALDKPRRNHIAEAQSFLQSTGDALDREDQEWSTLVDYVGKGIDLLVTRGQYTVPAAQLARGSADASVLEQVVNRVVDLGGEGKKDPYADLRKYLKWAGAGALALLALKIAVEFRR